MTSETFCKIRNCSLVILVEKLIQYIPDVPTLIEWDNDIPSLQRLIEEADKARVMANKYKSGNFNYAFS